MLLLKEFLKEFHFIEQNMYLLQKFRLEYISDISGRISSGNS